MRTRKLFYCFSPSDSFSSFKLMGRESNNEEEGVDAMGRESNNRDRSRKKGEKEEPKERRRRSKRKR